MWWYLGVGPLGGDWIMRAESLWMRLVPLWKRPHRATLPPFTVQGHCDRTTIYEPWSGPSLGTGSACTLILDFPASRTLKTCLTCPVYSILLYQSKHNWDRVKVKTLKKTKTCETVSYAPFKYLWKPWRTFKSLLSVFHSWKYKF